MYTNEVTASTNMVTTVKDELGQRKELHELVCGSSSRILA